MRAAAAARDHLPISSGFLVNPNFVQPPPLPVAPTTQPPKQPPLAPTVSQLSKPQPPETGPLPRDPPLRARHVGAAALHRLRAALRRQRVPLRRLRAPRNRPQADVDLRRPQHISHPPQALRRVPRGQDPRARGVRRVARPRAVPVVPRAPAAPVAACGGPRRRGGGGGGRGVRAAAGGVFGRGMLSRSSRSRRGC